MKKAAFKHHPIESPEVPDSPMEARAKWLADQFLALKAECRRDGINESHTTIFEGWIMQKLASLWIEAELATGRADQLEMRVRDLERAAKKRTAGAGS